LSLNVKVETKILKTSSSATYLASDILSASVLCSRSDVTPLRSRLAMFVDESEGSAMLLLY